ncbi:hypothetical protein [Cryptosporangium phraense]|uniref:Uncharacterized protein n=1 Tax=Cryptosporangium phraense TaxID=2593070 RepID=A0A545AWE9_9ACTN|nr:hypothetical protein [Cryptosporangium phraense]TQS45654.1 hypothetical protein FL583_07985 [Cryptosporangium phraense]
MTGQGFAREARAGVFTLVCLGLSIALHSWVSRDLPSTTAIFAGAGLVLVVAFGLAGRERRYPFILTTMLTAQAALHVLFEVLPHAGHHGEVPVTLGGLPSVTMVLAHLAAGLSAAAWLRGGETAVWRIGRRLARGAGPLRLLWTLVRALVLPTRPSALVDGAEQPVVRPIPGWQLSVIRRGPPALPAA